jgi:hypothetical protein
LLEDLLTLKTFSTTLPQLWDSLDPELKVYVSTDSNSTTLTSPEDVLLSAHALTVSMTMLPIPVPVLLDSKALSSLTRPKESGIKFLTRLFYPIWMVLLLVKVPTVGLLLTTFITIGPLPVNAKLIWKCITESSVITRFRLDVSLSLAIALIISTESL